MPAKFSELITLDRAQVGGRVLLRDVPLKVGTRVQGKLDPAVPRPVNRRHSRRIHYGR